MTLDDAIYKLEVYRDILTDALNNIDEPDDLKISEKAAIKDLARQLDNCNFYSSGIESLQ